MEHGLHRWEFFGSTLHLDGLRPARRALALLVGGLLLAALLIALPGMNYVAPPQPLVAEWPAQKLVYVADGQRLRVFRIGLGLAPLADVALPTGRPLQGLRLSPETGRLTLVMAEGSVEVDGRSLQ